MEQQVATKPEYEAEEALAAHAEAIRVLGKRVVKDVIEIGRRLTEVKRLMGHGNWLPWLDREFGWKEQSARNFMNLYEMSLKSPTVGDLNLDMRSLYLLAAPSTSEEARDEIIDAAKDKRLSLAQIKKMIADARAADRKEAEQKLKQQLTKAEADYEQREKKLREELSNRMTDAEVKKEIDRQLKPLREELRKAQVALGELEPTTDDKAEAARQKKAAQRLHRKYRTQHFANALEYLGYDTKDAAGYCADLNLNSEDAEPITRRNIRRALNFLQAIDAIANKRKWR